MKKSILTVTLLAVAVGLVSCKRQVSIWDDPQMWYQSTNSYDSSKIDVLYYVSTEVLSAEDSSGNVSWQSLLTPQDREYITGEMAWVEKNMFYEDFNVISPYYHQFTFESIWKAEKDEFDAAYEKVTAEACDAFDWYMSHSNAGRPFVLAGFSQGAMLALEVVKHMTPEQKSQMVACYCLGDCLTAEDLEHPNVEAAEGADDKGVVISFNSVLTREAIWPAVSAGAVTCINPVNWKTDSTAATFTYNGTTNNVHVDPQTNVLLIDTDSPEFYHSYYESAPFYLDAGVNPDNLHHWDLQFYAENIHDNALVRAGSKLK